MQARDAGWIQAPLWQPEITWTAPAVSSLPSWQDARRVCLDVECRDDDLQKLGPGVRRGGYVAGVAFAIEDGPAHYLPIRQEGGGNIDADAVWAYLRAQVSVFRGEAIFNYAPYDLDYLWENDVPIGVQQVVRDTQVAEPVIDELQTNYNLDAICARRGLPGKDERELAAHAKAWGVHSKKGLWRLHAGAVGRYAERDVTAPLALLRRQERDIEDLGLRASYDLESAVTPALMRMTRRGLRVDLDELDRVEAWAKERRQNYVDQIHHLTGISINSLANAKEVAPALRARGIDVPMPVHKGTGKPTPSIQKLWLQQIDDDVARAIISGREFDKLLGTYVGGFRKHLIGDRLHPTYKQLASDSDDAADEDEAEGARFGRCSSKHPNVQAQMKRSKEIQKRWRKVLVKNEGSDGWIAGDYCHSADTEVLTPRGWVRFDQLALGDEVAQWDDSKITFVHPTKHWRKEFDGELVEIHSKRRYSAAVTDNHVLIFRKTNGNLARVEASKFDTIPPGWRIPQCGQLVGGLSEDADLLRLVVAVQADATDRGISWRFWLSRKDKIERAKYLLDKLSIAYTTGFSAAKANQTSIQFRHDPRIDRYLSRKVKTFDRSALLGLDRLAREAFLDELYFWDGSRKQKIYFSTNLDNIETVQILYVLTGRCANKHSKTPKNRKTIGRVAPLSHEGGERDMVQHRRLAYRGDVYCVTVPSGAILTRRDNKVLVSSNSQQEPRWTIHYAEECRLPGAHRAGDVLRRDPLFDCYQMLVDLVKSPKDDDLKKLRDDLKEVYLGRCYGMGGGKMAKKLKLPTIWKTNDRTGYEYEAAGPEAQAIIDRFDRAVPYVRALARLCTKAGQEKKYIRGIDDRRIHFEIDENGNIREEHKGLNKLIQYAAAWQTKKALVALDREGFPLQLTVHDEFGYSSQSDDEARRMGEVMVSVAPQLRVPSRVDIKKGTSYGDTVALCTVTSNDIKKEAA